jgi:D-cysteine desulfhydrase
VEQSGAERPTRRPLIEIWPMLAERVPFARLGELPTPVASLAPIAHAVDRPGFEAWIKRDDVTSPVYGGNKVRTLEVLFGLALAAGADEIWSTGAFGSNHAAATVLHAPRVGLKPGVILFPQPRSWAALENLRVILAQKPLTRALPHWSFLPFGMLSTARRARRHGRQPFIMVPGGATPQGALGYVSAAFELAQQVAGGTLPAPRCVMLGVGSTCTSAGLLVGLALAARRGIGFAGKPPLLVSVRVTPWPVTARWRILDLAVRTSRLLAELTGEPELDARTLGARFRVDGRYLGRGYGYTTEAGRRAMRLWHECGGHELDTTYSAKAAATLLDAMRRPERHPDVREPVVLWSTKSSVPLPVVRASDLAGAPARMRRWIARAEWELGSTGELPEGYEPLGGNHAAARFSSSR